MPLVQAMTRDELDRWMTELEEDFVQATHRAFRNVSNVLRVQQQSRTAAGGEDIPLFNLDDVQTATTAWRTEQVELVKKLRGVFEAGAYGLSAAIDNSLSLPPQLRGATVIPEVINEAGSQYLLQASNRIARLGDAAWDGIRGTLTEGFHAGESIPQLTRRVREQAQFAEARARAVARTETIMAANGGAMTQAKSQPDVLRPTTKQWLSTKDGRTRLTHRIANGQQRPLDKPFRIGGASVQFPGDPLGPAAECVNCVIGSTKVSTTKATMVMRSWYEGEIIEIRTASQTLTVTPNHPVLTGRGWVAAGKLQPTDDVACGHFVGHFSEHDVKHEPTEIAHVYESAAPPRGTQSERRPGNFHGERRECEIRVVSPDRGLCIEDVTLSAEELEQFTLTLADASNTSVGSAQPCLLTARITTDDLKRIALGTSSIIGSSYTSASLLDRFVGHDPTILLGKSAECDAVLDEQASDHVARDVVLTGESELWSAVEVSLHEIVFIGRHPFSGHVFNLSTEGGWFIGNGIITHNCRCTTLFDVDEVDVNCGTMTIDAAKKESFDLQTRDQAVQAFSDLPAREIDGVVRAFSRINEKFPGVLTTRNFNFSEHYFGPQSATVGDWVGLSHMPVRGNIRLNSSMAQSGHIVDMWRTNVANGWWPAIRPECYGYEATMTHELAHAMHFESIAVWKRTHPGEPYDVWNMVADRLGRPHLDETKTGNAALRELVSSLGGPSEYGRTWNVTEWTAESLTEGLLAEDPSPVSRTLVEVLQEILAWEAQAAA